ncbi:peroxide-responsive transcriptional repressor PerRA [Leptospira idonii]|uniref:Transcriptional repressor n=1 Tax=Leptospira idonii TaxID=1193500 RepID=A0A4R9M2B0_9LEPT|nr:Fur family transcriptional regulator [Leptospira idonii]TGN19995.1 transcriptional repressor [Leptospira idonii]
MDHSYEKTKEILEKAGIRPTSQRLEMAHLLLSKDQHLQADEVFHLINEHFPHASRATIFNNLKLFAEKGVVGTLEIKPGITHFDSNTKRHHHAYDEETGEIIDIELDASLEEQIFESLSQNFQEKTGKRFTNASLVVTLKGKKN